VRAFCFVATPECCD